MPPLPSVFLDSLAQAPGFNREDFVRVHETGIQVTSVRLNPLKKAAELSWKHTRNIPWCASGLYLPERPSFTADPLFHAGAYYVQEASSMFLEQAFRQCLDIAQPLLVLDLCAAPGGKSTHMLSLLSPQSLLVSNEIIRTRVNVLEENIIKWGSVNSVITSNDPADFAALGSFFDCVVVDAPCSGSGLFRRDPDAIAEWSPDAVNLCSQRQQRILADILPCIKPGGLLIYSTCSYSMEEDEAIADWLIKEAGFVSRSIQTEPGWNLVESFSPERQAACYRFYPDKLEGEGFFMAVFQKPGEMPEARQQKSRNKQDKHKMSVIPEQEKRNISAWIKPMQGISWMAWQESVLLFPERWMPELLSLQSHLYIRRAGINIGTRVREELIPDHQLAMSDFLDAGIPAMELDREQALQYLRRSDLLLDTNLRGWVLMTYQGLALGWVKILSNRVNNYYPKDWRILNK